MELGEGADRPIRGVDAIAAFIGEERRRTYHLLETGQLPGYKLGGRWYLRPSRYCAHIDQLEAAAAAERGHRNVGIGLSREQPVRIVSTGHRRRPERWTVRR